MYDKVTLILIKNQLIFSTTSVLQPMLASELNENKFDILKDIITEIEVSLKNNIFGNKKQQSKSKGLKICHVKHIFHTGS